MSPKSATSGWAVEFGKALREYEAYRHTAEHSAVSFFFFKLRLPMPNLVSEVF